MKKRNVALCAIFSIVTFGLYGFYWLAQINNCVNELADPPKKTSGLVVVLLTIVTLGIYGFLQLGFVGWILMQSTINSMIPDEV